MSSSGFASRAWLCRYGRLIQEHIHPHVIPILIYDGQVGPHPPHSQGTGVLVRLESRYFALTAGHCVEECVRQGRKVYFAICSEPHRFCPKIAKSNHVIAPRGTVDFGYLEFHSTDASTIQAKYPVFSGGGRFDLRTRPDLGDSDEWVIVTGYPSEEAKNTSQYLAMRFMIALTLVAREDELPELGTRPPDGFRVLDLLLPPENIVSPVPGQFDQTVSTSFNGASGGGCWSLDLSSDPDEWTIDNKPRLCAIHTGTSRPVTRGGKESVFLREVPLVYHLRMIADDYPDLTASLEEQWPEICDVPPSSELKR